MSAYGHLAHLIVPRTWLPPCTLISPIISTSSDYYSLKEEEGNEGNEKKKKKKKKTHSARHRARQGHRTQSGIIGSWGFIHFSQPGHNAVLDAIAKRSRQMQSYCHSASTPRPMTVPTSGKSLPALGHFFFLRKKKKKRKGKRKKQKRTEKKRREEKKKLSPSPSMHQSRIAVQLLVNDINFTSPPLNTARIATLRARV